MKSIAAFITVFLMALFIYFSAIIFFPVLGVLWLSPGDPIILARNTYRRIMSEGFNRAFE